MRSIEELSSEEKKEEIDLCVIRFKRRKKEQNITEIKVNLVPDQYDPRCDSYEVTGKINGATVRAIIPREYVAKDSVETISLSSCSDEEESSNSSSSGETAQSSTSSLSQEAAQSSTSSLSQEAAQSGTSSLSQEAAQSGTT